ncbi:hypothetical protein P171DRAFT_15861 [Karstenula rhodostoma CBS 690.94]|uniref:Uncharacterized protein n=1 Tax=Karstenula rhodostoma CBS 690.94 TaxID=1392251 RepID=A0A9P4PZY7_9PLEO|nr:hypothetical protein P171DRAFT_15861 [Karstenula rhodostoma CBS 690.94]
MLQACLLALMFSMAHAVERSLSPDKQKGEGKARRTDAPKLPSADHAPSALPDAVIPACTCHRDSRPQTLCHVHVHAATS